MILPIPNRIKFSLFLFVLSSVCYIYGGLFCNVTLEITSTIFLIPSLTFLYFLKSKEKTLPKVWFLFFHGRRITNLIEDVFKLHFWCYYFLGCDTRSLPTTFLSDPKRRLRNNSKRKNNLFIPHSLCLFVRYTVSIIRTSWKLYLPNFILWNMLSRN